MKVFWTPAAKRNLKEIEIYISKDSIRYADETIGKLYREISVLEHNPYMGKMVIEICNNDFRELVSGNYRIIYKVHEDKIYILAICHSARMLKKVLKLRE
ncbi:hypothetical protein EZS27_019396 [termite gut metagenome]|uniref:Uncharacterized protein n=1 Tax=termite gut metagenome TaxID=433724 RepID=A0A5J4RD90_9ZZZZ